MSGQSWLNVQAVTGFDSFTIGVGYKGAQSDNRETFQALYRPSDLQKSIPTQQSKGERDENKTQKSEV